MFAPFFAMLCYAVMVTAKDQHQSLKIYLRLSIHEHINMTKQNLVSEYTAHIIRVHVLE